ncbi:MAG: hypothetical protein IJV22_04075 [Bacteroidales bacterium]|nr:hypothetical protein [Bacteroidales bacterium]
MSYSTPLCVVRLGRGCRTASAPLNYVYCNEKVQMASKCRTAFAFAHYALSPRALMGRGSFLRDKKWGRPAGG